MLRGGGRMFSVMRIFNFNTHTLNFMALFQKKEGPKKPYTRRGQTLEERMMVRLSGLMGERFRLERDARDRVGAKLREVAGKFEERGVVIWPQEGAEGAKRGGMGV